MHFIVCMPSSHVCLPAIAIPLMQIVFDFVSSCFITFTLRLFSLFVFFDLALFFLESSALALFVRVGLPDLAF